ncbi:flagellar biosynthesis repressor FlbT [Bartonella sp. TP]|uniref:flagellar biosynthesis repressor FlbT n=1 Tax=Bartonella sp. TP TaxID=3057550 RepID=UPI0025B1D53F|nr:flagellar biosynthesis repressor FlbT [Bartonella sp. TP]MDN5249013.1 flagellar biosynthesis repressor FlbT [Alphaproteobacteria bacterium]WJW80258.1 flagellar biosynthesis repressor FlbT [Bartonella sp. TP]
MKITLKAGEKLFINGAVIASDKKVTLELINDAVFLLENHVLQKEDTDTPLKQLYFAAQIMLMEPKNMELAFPVFVNMLQQLLKTFSDIDIIYGLSECVELAQSGKMFEILKILRGLFGREAEIMGKKINP